MKKLFLLVSLLFFCTPKAQAYYTFLTTGEIPKSGTYKASTFVQFLTDGPVGTTLNAQIESHFRSDASLLFVVGAGTHQMASASIKWVPIPDLINQASIGMVLGGHFGSFKIKSANTTVLQSQKDFSIFTKAFVGKNLAIDVGQIHSFASLHLGFQSLSQKKNIPIFLAAGTELQLFAQPKFNFIAELGFNLNQAFSYISIGAVFIY